MSSMEDFEPTVRNAEILFQGKVLKQSEILRLWRERYVKIVRIATGKILALYWVDYESERQNQTIPRGILDVTSVMLELDPDNQKIELRHIQDLLRTNDCFGRRRDLTLQIRTETMGIFRALSAALGAGFADTAKTSSEYTRYNTEKNTVKSSISSEDQVVGVNEGEMVTLEQKYQILGELGKGAFSIVYRAKEQDDDREVALKVVLLKKLPARERKTQLRYLDNEIEVLKRVASLMGDNKNIVHLLDHMTETRPTYRVCLVLELCKGGELFDRIVSQNSFSEKQAKIVLRDLTQALAQLHAVGIVHRDLKPENLVYDTPAPDAILKITDFGLALDTSRENSDLFKANLVGTLGYFAPEVLALRYTPACDVWSLGVVLYILLCGYPPISGRTVIEVQKNTRLGKFKFHSPEWDTISDDAKDLVSKMMEYQPRYRITAKEILNHSWLHSKTASDLRPIPVDRHREFNSKRKLKAAAHAIIWGARLNSKRKERLATLAQKISPAGFSPAALTMIKNAFENTTDAKTKRIASSKELRSILSKLGYHELPIERMFLLFDKNGDGHVDYTELLTGLSTLESPGEESLKFAFSLYDKNGSGGIDKDELADILALSIANNPHMDAQKISSDLYEAFDGVQVSDENGVGNITFTEFKRVCESKPYLLQSLLSRKLSNK